MRSSTEGGLSGVGRGGGAGSRSKSWASNSAPETPSMVQWWIFVTTAICPPRNPSTMYISHSGLARSSWRLQTSPTNRANSSTPPGAGSAEWRMWYSMSNAGSSTQYGWPRRKGTSTSRLRKIGASSKRELTSSRILSKEYPPGTVDGSKTAAIETCMCRLGVSRYRNVASSPVSCSMVVSPFLSVLPPESLRKPAITACAIFAP